jgi:hypothetical protein
MEPAAELLIRSALHDMGNILSGIRGILDLSDPSKPLNDRDRRRLEAVLQEGMSLVDRTRHLSLGTGPQGLAESPEAWRTALLEQLEPLSTLFRAPIEVRWELPPAFALPGPALRELVHGMARLLLPYAGEAGLRVTCRQDSGTWRLDFEPAEAVPDCLLPTSASGRKDIATRWVLFLLEALHLKLVHEGETLTASPLP